MEPFCTYFHKNKMYHVCRNNEGYLELWRGSKDVDKKTGKGADHDRIVTNVKDVGELPAYLNPPKKKRKRYNPHKDANQLKLE